MYQARYSSSFAAIGDIVCTHAFRQPVPNLVRGYSWCSIIMSFPFELDEIDAYQHWREQKLVHAARLASGGAGHILVDIADPYELKPEERQAVLENCRQHNMSLYRLPDAAGSDKSLVHSLGEQFGMSHLDANLRADEDSVTSLEVRGQEGNQYIPYTNRALSWHTDGYYNELDKQIFALIMHCVSPAAEGGVNHLLDPDIAYIALRDENPAFIEALMHPEAMTIPPNIENDKELRGAQPGPVFMKRPDGRMHMRYSARKRNIEWRDTPETRTAVDMINDLLANSEYVITHRMQTGHGIICNNVLHNRTGFEDSDSQKRLMYRARFYDYIK
jgi:alpha-ketoglutarate-dependent taurine dioxygenase